MIIPKMKPRERPAWKMKREIEFAFRLGANRKARSAFYKRSKSKYSPHPDTQNAVCNLHDCGLDASVISILIRRFGLVDMVVIDPYVLPTMEQVIEYGIYRGCRIRYSRRHDAIIQEHELILEGDHWLLYYSPDGYWVADCLPF